MGRGSGDEADTCIYKGQDYFLETAAVEKFHQLPEMLQ
jgi:hypothetical protein